jgi:hypothetical protein
VTVAQRRASPSLALLVLAAAVWVPATVHAQAWLPLAREANLSILFQHINLAGHFYADGSKVPGSIPSIANLGIVEFEYGLTDKLAVGVRLPYVASKWTGSHDEPDIVDLRHIAEQLRELTPVTEELTSLDTGSYYATFQDFGLTLRYNLLEKGLVVTPVLGATIPSHDYRTVGEAAPGQNRLALHTGVNLGRLLDPFLPRMYVHARYTYSFVQPVYDVSLNRSNAEFEAGYGVTPIVTVRAIAAWSESHGGLHWTEVYNRGFGLDGRPADPVMLLDHDRLIANRYWHLGGGGTVAVTDSLDLDAAVMKFVSGADTHYGVGVTVGMTWRLLKPAPSKP